MASLLRRMVTWPLLRGKKRLCYMMCLLCAATSLLSRFTRPALNALDNHGEQLRLTTLQIDSRPKMVVREDTLHLSNSVEAMATTARNILETSRPTDIRLNRFVGSVNMSSFGDRIRKFVKPAMTEDEKHTVYYLASVFMDIAMAYNLTYFVHSGTLLGSYRHHDFIPWDDDFDVGIMKSQKSQLLSVLRNISAATRKFIVHVVPDGDLVKVYHPTRYVDIRGYPWKWPNLDFAFYEEDETHIWEDTKSFRRYKYAKSITFPLHLRPFGTLMVPSPRDSFAYLKVLFKESTCESLTYSHRFEGGTITVKFDCADVSHVYPFVHRSSNSGGAGGIVETLKLGDAVLHSVVVQEPTYAITKPYALELLQAVKRAERKRVS